MQKPTTPFHPLKRIALCLSGGGYRAAAFQLGCISYLHSKTYDQTRLLDSVKAISTVSGGTILGIYYAQQANLGTPFPLIYNKFIRWLSKTDLVKKGLKKINEDGQWNHPYKRTNMINAFAELYDSTLLNGGKLKDLEPTTKTHIEFLCFNSTEFNTGLRYRFQVGKSRVYFGSKGLQLGKKIYREFRLGDVTAASSAFTGGFEPIAMPEDFVAPDSMEFKAIKQKKGYREPVGLMDGGIFDNQGITGIEAFENEDGESPYDLVLVSDVSSPYLEDFDFSELKHGGSREASINQLLGKLHTYKVRIHYAIIALLLTGVLCTLLGYFYHPIVLGIGLTLSLVGIVHALLYGKILKKIRRTAQQAKTYVNNQIPPYFKERIASFQYKDLPLKKIELLLLDRYHSLRMLVPNIFLKQIRRLHYQRLYTNEAYTHKRMSCLVRQLTEKDYGYKKMNGLDDFAYLRTHLSQFEGKTLKKLIGPKLGSYTEKAATFGTTLWFNQDDVLEERLQCLVVSGQATCCLNLIVYLTKLLNGKMFSILDKKTQKELKSLRDEILEDWVKFKNEPTFLHQTFYNNP